MFRDQVLRVLMVEDSQDDVKLLLRELRRTGYQIVYQRVETGEELRSALVEQSWNIVLSDYSMPHFNGLEALKLLKASGLDLPFILISGTVGEELAVAAMKAGAHDYLLKGKLARLGATIERELREAEVRRARKEAEAALLKLNLELESKVLERTTQLTQANQQLVREIAERTRIEKEVRKSLEKEKELNELKSRFVSLVSHEFRTPLTTILTSTEFLEHYAERISEEKKRKHFYYIKTAIENMTQMLNDILILGKAEAGKQVFQPVKLELTKFCRELVEELQVNAGSNYDLNFRFHGQPPPAYGKVDERLLRQILTNLLTNAIKYSPQGGKIELELFYTPQQAVFVIRDQGMGIPTKDLPHLFEPFHRSENVSEIQGTGLGLAIVKKGVEAHRGNISLDTKLGVGTTFEVIIPFD